VLPVPTTPASSVWPRLAAPSRAGMRAAAGLTRKLAPRSKAPSRPVRGSSSGTHVGRHEHFVTRVARVSRAAAASRVCWRRFPAGDLLTEFPLHRAEVSCEAPRECRGAGIPRGAERRAFESGPEIQNDKRGNHMDTSSPDMGQHRPKLFERIGILFPADEVPAAPLKAGYGRCSVNGCPCPGFAGNQQLCENCGHNYSMHW
jgi:hypothetical protein